MTRRHLASLIRKNLKYFIGGALAGATLIAIAQTQAPSAPRTPATPGSPVTVSGDRTMATSRLLAREASGLVNLLDAFHYNHEAVKPGAYESVIPDYMEALDSQRLFFLKSDKTQFMAEFGNALYYNLKDAGNVDPAYKIFGVYEQRVKSRTAWVFEQLARDMTFDTEETYAYDRSKVEWPESQADADELWRKRIRYEVLGEVLATKASDRETPEGLKKAIQDAKDTIKKRYDRLLWNVASYKSNELAELFLTNVAQLYDPHSSYFSPESYDDFSINIRLNLYGIGALLQLDKNYICRIQEIVPGGPAHVSKALMPDDKIIAVGQGDDKPVDVTGWKLRDIVQLIRGKKGTQVHLTVIPADATDDSVRKEVVITRDLVKLDNARAHAAVFEVPAADGKSTLPLGVISLPAFYGADAANGGTSSSTDVAELIKRLQAVGIKGLVLDLRHNGGGFLSEAIDVAGLFISTGPVVQVKNVRNGVVVDPDEDPNIAYRGPLAVLVDRYSASASEIVAGALQNYGRAIVIGNTSTHGKGTVQQIVEMEQLLSSRNPLSNMLNRSAQSDEKFGAAKITIQKFYLPNGSSTQRRGVVPDIILPSIDEFITDIGEGDMPRALMYDEIPAAPQFRGRPLDGAIVSSLLESSRQRQASLEEFKYLSRSIERFKTQQAQKTLSLSLKTRLAQKEADLAFVREMKAQREALAKSDYPYKEVRLAPATQPAMRAKAESTEESIVDDNERDLPYARVDIPLRESFRILGDAVALASQPAFVLNGREPLTAVTPPTPGRN